ncbi:uncharacterized protein LOC120052350 [Salvelinus namaycush]|uniref:Uncharacterized protein LOC120052350 n=1 Tax=Salvelinus namaycush TaxID=8040 RepID=A0A8U0R3I7_SALNM|nr:uncharacterized protein LOC120052350 [Salvelinus namaycush]
MAKLQSLGVFVNKRLTLAAVEIMGAVEKVVAEYQEEISRSKEENDRLRRLLRIRPEIKLYRLHSLPLCLTVSEEEVTPVQQQCDQEKWNSSLGTKDPEPMQIKEEEVGTTQEAGQLQGLEADIIEFIFTPPCVKSDCGKEDSLLSLPQTETMEKRERDSKQLDLKPFGTVTHLDITSDSPDNQDNVSSYSSAVINDPVGFDISPPLDPNSPLRKPGTKASTTYKKPHILPMPRVRVRTTDRGLFHPETFERASQDVLVGGQSVRSAAKAHGVCHVTLFRYCRRKKDSANARLPAYRAHNRVFSQEQENHLKEYLLRAAEIYFRLSPKEVRRLAYQLAQHYHCKYPETWVTKEMAGKDWFTSFLKRHPGLSIRQPQATSLLRATSFNATNVSQFFNNLSTILGRHNFEAKDVWNMDETSTTTVQVPNKIIANRGRKQVRPTTSVERGTMVTMALAVNAQGNSIPPHFIFPHNKYLDHFLRDGPTGCMGTASGSGWMQENDFLAFLQHFVKYTRASPESPQLLLLDNQASHLSLQGMDYCKANGVVLLSFPPHCSHKLQPLDRSVYGPLRRYINSAIDCWIKTYPGKTVSIYDLPGIVATALPSAVTPANIMAGFHCTGIWPLNPTVFTEADFSPAFVTGRPAPTTTEEDRGGHHRGAPGGRGGSPQAQPRVEVNVSPVGRSVSPGQGEVQAYSTSGDPLHTVSDPSTPEDLFCDSALSQSHPHR